MMNILMMVLQMIILDSKFFNDIKGYHSQWPSYLVF